MGITVTVTDSRGRTASQNTAVTVLAYKKPWALIREAVRCDEGGNVQPDGAWLKLVFDAGVTALTGNTAQYKAVRTVHGGGSAQQVTLTDYDGPHMFDITELMPKDEVIGRIRAAVERIGATEG